MKSLLQFIGLFAAILMSQSHLSAQDDDIEFPEPPSTPWVDNISSIKETGFTVHWIPNDELATGFFVVALEGENFPSNCDHGNVAQVGDVRSYTFDNLKAGTSYMVGVCAFNNKGSSFPGPWLSIVRTLDRAEEPFSVAITQAVTNPEDPKNFQLSWTATEANTTYQIEYKDSINQQEWTSKAENRVTSTVVGQSINWKDSTPNLAARFYRITKVTNP